MANKTLPATHKALVQETLSTPLTIRTLPVPQPTPGTAIIRVHYVPLLSYTRDVYDGTRSYAYATPLTVGAMAIGRVAALGVDATKLKVGDLVYTDCFIRGRDDPDTQILVAAAEGMTDASKRLMADAWREGSAGEYMAAPLENVFAVDERRVLGEVEKGGLGWKEEWLAWIQIAMVPYGGLKAVELEAGETVLIAPATGQFGSAGVVIALAMGANVIAMGRNEEELRKLRELSPKVQTVKIQEGLAENVAALKELGPIDAYLDISPRMAQQSTHLKAGILSLRPRGRVALMGGFLEDVAIPHRYIMRLGITLQGVWMYERRDHESVMRLMLSSLINIQNLFKVVGMFEIEQWKEAFDVAAEAGRLGELVLFKM